MKKFWPFVFYFFQYAGVAFMMPYMVLYYQDRGLTGSQIGLLAGLYPLTGLISTPLWTGIADVTRRHRLVLSATLLLGSLAIFMYPFLSGYALILLFVALSSFFLAPISSLADSATMWMLGDEKDQYGRLRLGGTIGFALAAFFSGQMVQSYGLKMAFWGCAIAYGLAFLVGLKFEFRPVKEDKTGQVPFLQGLGILLKNPHMALLLVGALLGGFAMAVSNNYFFPYMRELGADPGTMGLALTLGTVVEVPVLFFGSRLLKFFKPFPLFLFSLFIAAVRLLLFAIAANPNQVLVFQLLNGLTFPTLWMAGVSYMDQKAPEGMHATAQGILGLMVFGVGTSLGGYVGGNLLESIGARNMCLVFGLITMAVVVVIAVVGKLLPPEKAAAVAA